MKAAAKVTLLLAVIAGVRATDTNPVAKVLELLSSLEAKIIGEGEVEQKVFEEYVEWCDDTSKNGAFEVKSLKSKKAKLEATIDKCTSDSAACSTEIEKLAASIAAAEAELKDATAIRDKEKAEFLAAEGELVESVDALDRAIAIIEREMAKNPALLQSVDTANVQRLVQSLTPILDACAFSIPDQRKLAALVQTHSQGQEGDEAEAESDMAALTVGAPAPDAYKSQSGGIVDVLEDLKEKAEGELSDLRKAETASAHNFDMLKQSLSDTLAADNKDMDDEEAAKSEADQTKATSEGDLAMTVKALAEAEKALATAQTDCMGAAARHEESTTSRAGELKALGMAKKVLQETSSGAVSQSYSLLQVSSGMRLRSSNDLRNVEVVHFVKTLAKKHHSAALAQLASKIMAALRLGSASGGDPFAKVKGLIQAMIDKLVEEGEAEAKKHAWCVSETAKTEAKKAELEDDIAKLTAKIDKAIAASAQLKKEVKELQAQLAELAQSQMEMDKLRGEQHDDFLVAKEDLELGLSGVRKALGVLRDYYGAALLQQPVVPEHEKASGAGSSIIGMLEVIEADFATGLTERETAEATEQEDYDKTTQENKVSKTMKTQDAKYKTSEFTSLDKAVSDLLSDRASEQSELDAVLEYYDKLKAKCAPKKETYAERVARREAEIAGLKEALNILETETVAAFGQVGKRGLRR